MQVIVKQNFGSPFFQYFKLPGPRTNGLKYFRYWLRFREVIQILGLKSMTPRGYDIPGRFTHQGIQ